MSCVSLMRISRSSSFFLPPSSLRLSLANKTLMQKHSIFKPYTTLSIQHCWPQVTTEIYEKVGMTSASLGNWKRCVCICVCVSMCVCEYVCVHVCVSVSEHVCIRVTCEEQAEATHTLRLPLCNLPYELRGRVHVRLEPRPICIQAPLPTALQDTDIF